MKISTYKCDACGTQKGATNHWYTLVTRRNIFELKPWSNDDADSNDAAHICSESCASKALSKWLANRNKAGQSVFNSYVELGSGLSLRREG